MQAFRMVLAIGILAASPGDHWCIEARRSRGTRRDLATFSKIQPYLAELRNSSASDRSTWRWLSWPRPMPKGILTRRREAIRAGVKARAVQQRQSQSAT